MKKAFVLLLYMVTNSYVLNRMLLQQVWIGQETMKEKIIL